MTRLKKELTRKGFNVLADDTMVPGEGREYYGITIEVRNNDIYFMESWNTATFTYKYERTGRILAADELCTSFVVWPVTR